MRAPAPLPHALLVADVMSATQDISFLRPLAGEMRFTKVEPKFDADGTADILERLRPDYLVLSRATRPNLTDVVGRARRLGIPSIFHLDDNLLAVPRSLGEEKYGAYNHPARLASLLANLNAVDLVYASTPELRRQLIAAGVTRPVTAGRIYCALRADEVPAQPPPLSAGPVIGYMGTGGHAADLAAIAPAIAALMDSRPDLTLELFGGLEPPAGLAAHSGRIRAIPKTATYDDYLARLVTLGWWVGLAPLEDNPFNRCKADTKWVEYTRGGIPVVASDLPVYAFACADGAGRRVPPDAAAWVRAVAALLDDPARGRAQVAAARARLAEHYDAAMLKDQVRTVLNSAGRLARDPGTPVPAVTSGARARDAAHPPVRPAPDRARRLLFIANGPVPTLQLSFLRPLAPLVAEGRVHVSLTTEAEMIRDNGDGALFGPGMIWLRDRIASARPDTIVCCRYSGPHASAILAAAEELNVPLVVHVDDDLLNIPPEIGAAKYRSHNAPRKLLTVRTLLEGADLIYCSTEALHHRLRAQGFRRPIRHGDIYCAARVRRRPPDGPIRRIGYMGFDHAHDFEIARPAVEAILDRHPEIAFELFGSIPMPASFMRFGDRARTVAPVRDYAAFVGALSDRAWDIGICPLARTPFNAVKANTKWVEYTSAGMAVVATGGMAYDDCMRGGRGLPVDDGEWEAALDLLIARPDVCRAMAHAGQRRLMTDYSEAALRDQVLDVLDEAHRHHAARHAVRPLASSIRTVA